MKVSLGIATLGIALAGAPVRAQIAPASSSAAPPAASSVSASGSASASASASPAPARDAAAAAALAQVEAEIGDSALALLRLPSAVTAGGPPQALAGALADPVAGRRLLATLFRQIDRHFELSPSLHAYGDADALAEALSRQLPQPPERPDLDSLRALVTARIAEQKRMRHALSIDFAQHAKEPLRRSPLGALALVLDRRQARARARFGDRPSAPIAPSYFAEGRWAVGWAGGPLAKRIRSGRGEGEAHAISYNGFGVAALAGVYEMAKQQKAAARATFGVVKDESGLAQARVGAAGVIESLVLDTRLAVWGVTERGLVPATLRRAAFFGDACISQSAGETRVEVAFAAPIGAPLLAVFASSAPIDPSRARVQIERRRFLAPLWDLLENSLTERQTVTVDLDGDGIADLRVIVSSDTAVGQAPAMRPAVDLLPVGGWYANDVYSLEANVDGAWRVLSLYNVVTCT